MPPVHATVLPERTAPPNAPARERASAPAFVDARWLLANLESTHVVDTRPAASFAASDVPGSTSLPIDELLLEDTSRPSVRLLASRTAQALARRGILPDEHLVLVDD